MAAALAISAAEYIKYIYDYGPAALVVFVSLVLLVFSSRQLKKNPTSSMHNRVYMGNWVAIAVLIVAATVVWLIQHFGQQAAIRGNIGTLPAKYLVRAPLSEEDVPLYVQPIYDDRDPTSLTYRWIIAPRNWQSVPKKIEIEVYEQLTRAETSGYDKTLRLNVNKKFYSRPVEIRYDSKSDGYKLFDEDNTEGTPLQFVDTKALPPPPSFTNVAVVYAAAVFDAPGMKARLESSDPAIRRAARTELAKRVSEAMPSIDEWLADPGSSASLQVGVLGALAANQNPAIETRLTQAALQRIVSLATSENTDLSNSARAFLEAHGTLAVHTALLEWLKTNQGKRRINDTALIDMDVLYNLGVKQKDSYGGRQNATLFTSAQDSFSQAWDDRRFAENADQVYFAKALYGWGLLLADRAVLEKNADGTKKAGFVQAAQNKFREFLKAADRGNGSAAYPEPEQILRAKGYLANPAMKF